MSVPLGIFRTIKQEKTGGKLFFLSNQKEGKNFPCG